MKDFERKGDGYEYPLGSNVLRNHISKDPRLSLVYDYAYGHRWKEDRKRGSPENKKQR